MSANIAPALRTAVLACAGAIGELSSWQNEPAVFTRRPVPDDAAFPLSIVNPPASLGDADGLTSDRPIAVHDIGVYGFKGAPGTPEDQTRKVERAAYALRDHFHRNRFSVQLEGFSVIGIRASGPIPAPVDDEKQIGRLVTVEVQLRRVE